MDEFAGRRFDDETDIPEDWVHIAPDAMTVDDGHHSSGEYSRIEVRQGQMFHDKVHLQHVVQRWALSKKKQFKVVISNPTTWDVKCVTQGCTWRVHGHMPRTETNFIATIVQPHSCLLHTTLIKHKNMTAEFVSNVMYGEIVEKVGMSPFRIMLAIQNRYGYEMSYDMAWRAKQLALEKRFGNYKDSYHNLPTLLATIQVRDPRTVIHIDDYINEKGDCFLK